MVERKCFLDWLRVLSFGALILFHVGMLYVTWGYNLKSPRIYPMVEWAMEATSAWRMPLLFVISGVACRFLIAKLGAARFTRNRLARLGLVILTAMLLVNPEQVWVQLLSQGATTQGYFEFWTHSYLTSDPVLIHALHRPMPTWDHLWFVVYLLPYTLLFAALYSMTAKRLEFVTLPLWALLIGPTVLMVLANCLMGTITPFTHSLVNDWGAHLKWFGLFLFGTAMAPRKEFWDSVQQHRRSFALLAGILLIVYLGCRVPWLHDWRDFTWTILYRTAEGAYGWTAVLAIFGYAARWLDKTSSSLRYLNDAVLPVYVLHQPALLTAGFILFPMNLPIGIEVIAIIAATALGSLLLYHMAIRPWTPMRFLFGLKTLEAASLPVRSPAS